MIEFFTLKRMVFSTLFLGGLTILVLIIESKWAETSNSGFPDINANASNSHCWETEDWHVIEECHPCTDFEIASQSNEACQGNNLKELVACKNSGHVYRSCAKVSWIEEAKFWKFEFVMFVLAIVSYSIVFFRQKILNRRILIRIQRQLANYDN